MKPEDLAPGKVIGRYRLEREVGRGGMGVVWLARGPGGEARAIKMLSYEGRLADEVYRRFLAEIRLLASMENIFVVRFFDAGKIEVGGETTLWVALEYIDGPTLRIILEQQQPIDPEDVARWGMQIAQGVAAAHKLHVVHRDLKPENVGLSNGVIKVFDFGIAKWRQSGHSTAASMRIGTLLYMSPEQESGTHFGKIDQRTDIYALGLILYELALLEHPYFEGQWLGEHEIRGRVANMTPKPLSELKPGFPTDLSDIAHRCVQKHKDQRFATMADVAGALEDALLRLRAEKHASTIKELGFDDGDSPLFVPAKAAPLVTRRVLQNAPAPSPGAAPHTPRGTQVSPQLGARPVSSRPGDATPPPVVRDARHGAPVPAPGAPELGAWRPGHPRTVQMGIPDVVGAIAEARERAAAPHYPEGAPHAAPILAPAQLGGPAFPNDTALPDTDPLPASARGAASGALPSAWQPAAAYQGRESGTQIASDSAILRAHGQETPPATGSRAAWSKTVVALSIGGGILAAVIFSGGRRILFSESPPPVESTSAAPAAGDDASAEDPPRVLSAPPPASSPSAPAPPPRQTSSVEPKAASSAPRASPRTPPPQPPVWRPPPPLPGGKPKLIE
jgi:serine/threonine-protein kinase